MNCNFLFWARNGLVAPPVFNIKAQELTHCLHGWGVFIRKHGTF